MWKESLWGQFGAAIDMVENAMAACPEELFSDRTKRPEFWYMAYHTLFWMDLYLADSVEDFTPAAFDTFGKAELLPEDEAPDFERPYTRAELQAYLESGREKVRTAIENLTRERAQEKCGFEWVDTNVLELFLYNMRHVQHHAAQMNFVLRQMTNSAPAWVKKTRARVSES